MPYEKVTRRKFLIAGSAAATGLGILESFRSDDKVYAAKYDLIVEMYLDAGDESNERTANPDPRFNGTDPPPATFTSTQYRFTNLDSGKYDVYASSPGYYTDEKFHYLDHPDEVCSITLQHI